MTGKLFGKKTFAMLTIACLAVMGQTGTSNAAEITFDLRATGGTGVVSDGGKSVWLQNTPGQTVELQLVAVIQNNNGNRADDGFRLFHGGLTSVENPGPQGNLAVPTIKAEYNTSSSAAGAQNPAIDGNPDFEIGGSSVTLPAGWLVVNNGVPYDFETGAGTGGTEFLLATTSWTIPGPPNFFGSTSLNVFLRLRSGVQGNYFSYTTDGTARTLNSTSAGFANLVTVGTPVVIMTPEPAGVAILGMTALMTIQRRRRSC